MLRRSSRRSRGGRVSTRMLEGVTGLGRYVCTLAVPTALLCVVKHHPNIANGLPLFGLTYYIEDP